MIDRFPIGGGQFIARPVVGGHFALLALPKPGAAGYY